MATRRPVAPPRPKLPEPAIAGSGKGPLDFEPGSPNESSGARIAVRKFLLGETREITPELADVFSDVLDGLVDGANLKLACKQAGIKQSEYLVILAESQNLNDRFEKLMELILISKCTEMLGLIREARDTSDSFASAGVKAALGGAEKGVKMGLDMRERRLERSKASAATKTDNPLFAEVDTNAEGIDPVKMAAAKAQSLKGAKSSEK